MELRIQRAGQTLNKQANEYTPRRKRRRHSVLGSRLSVRLSVESAYQSAPLFHLQSSVAKIPHEDETQLCMESALRGAWDVVDTQ